jgi:glycosyltransferase involved in cell wall biosynthesis
MAAHLQPWVRTGQVTFTGSLAHELVPRYMDAADLCLSPHIPFADGTEFFGSPTKIFEYMAMAKAIIASNLGQIGQVLTHDQTAWLVSPGSVDELAAGLKHLVEHPETLARLGRNAREAVLSRYTWQRNAQAVLESVGMPGKAVPGLPTGEARGMVALAGEPAGSD